MTDPTSRSDAPSPAATPRPSGAVVRDYGDPAREYAALRTGALLVDRSHRERWVLRGARARETLTGLVTNDIGALAAGQGCYAAALTPKGRIVADLRVLAIGADAATGGASSGEAAAVPAWLDGAELLVDLPARAAEGFAGVLRKYVNPRVTPYQRVTDQIRALGVYGVRARDALAGALGAPPAALAALAPHAHATVSLDGATFLVVRVPDLGLDGFEVIGPSEAVDAAWARLGAAGAGVVAGGEGAWTIARIEAGLPEWGLDMDDTTIPQEANMDDLHAISYTKGCYTGQEVVARVHFRGHVNRHLRGLAFPPDGGPVPHGAELRDETGKVVGDVRSSALSPRLGGVAIGMVRREVPLGALLTARWGAASPEGDGSGESSSDGAATERGVTVGTLPFPL